MHGGYLETSNCCWKQLLGLGWVFGGHPKGGLGQDGGGSELELWLVLSGRGSYSWPLGREGGAGSEGGRQVGTRGQEGHLALPMNQKMQSRLTWTQWQPGDGLQWAHGGGGTPTWGPGADLTLLSPSAEKGGHASTRRQRPDAARGRGRILRENIFQRREHLD